MESTQRLMKANDQIHQSRNPKPSALHEFQDAVAKLSNAYASDKHELWNRVVQVLSGTNPELAMQIYHMRERGNAMSRLRSMCTHSSPGNPTQQDLCRAALRAYQHLLRADWAFTPPPAEDPGEPETLRIFLAEDATSYAKASRAALQGLSELGMDVSVVRRAHFTTRNAQRHYSFFLIGPGEPEHISNARSSIIDFEFVPTGRENVHLAVQYGGLDVTVLFDRKTIHVELFARDEMRESFRGERASAMQYLMCASLTAVGVELRRAGAAAADAMDSYVVSLSALDRWSSGKLLKYYSDSFGFVSEHPGSHSMTAEFRNVVAKCLDLSQGAATSRGRQRPPRVG